MSLNYDLKNNNNTKISIYFNDKESENLNDIKLILNNSEDLDVYSDNINNNLYQELTDYISEIVTERNLLCKGLNPNYVLESFDKVDAIIVLSSLMNVLPNGNIYGFASVKFNEYDNSLYIDVICSYTGINKGAGSILISSIENICKKLLITKIHLRSVKNSISFYLKCGFIKENPLCNDMCLMIKTLKKNGGKRKTRKTNKNIKKTKRKYKSI